MKISVIIPTYKPGDYIWDCLDSLQNQTCDMGSFEVVIVLNGDKEPFYDQLTAYLNRSKLHYKLIHTDEKGVSDARNTGIDYAVNNQAEYILFLDDDDKLSNGFIADCINKANPHQVVICNSKTFINDDDVSFGDDYISRSYSKNIYKKYSIFRYRSFFSSVCAKLIPLHVIGDFRFDTRFRIGEDSLFGFQISKNIHKCVLSSADSIYYRRIREGSASRIEDKKLNKLKINFEMAIEYTKVYFSNPFQYDLKFYLSRLIAEINCAKRTLLKR